MKKFLTDLSVTAFIFMLLSAFMTVNTGAEPYTQHLIVADNKTIIKATDFDTVDFKKAPAEGNKDIRPDETVNTEVGGSAFGGNIGWIAKGDWVQYTTYVDKDGKYRIEAWLASDAAPTGGIKLYCNDKEVGTSENAKKEGWQVYSLYFIADVDLKAGKCILKTEFTGGVNFSALEITPLGADGNPVWMPVEHVIRKKDTNIIKAIDFDPGKYNKAPVTDGSKEIRPNEEVNTEKGGSEFGGNICSIAAGDWVQYTVNAQTNGKYKFDAWLASDADPTGAVTVYCDDIKVGTSENSAKNGWQAYELYPAGEIDMTRGEHIIKVEFTGGVNFSALEVTRTGDITEPAETTENNADTGKEAPAAGTDVAAGGNNTLLILVIIAVAVVVIVVVVAVIAKKKNKRV